MYAEHQPPAQVDGQTSINDYLTPSTSILPVELREPTDVELNNFLINQSRRA